MADHQQQHDIAQRFTRERDDIARPMVGIDVAGPWDNIAWARNDASCTRYDIARARDDTSRLGERIAGRQYDTAGPNSLPF